MVCTINDAMKGKHATVLMKKKKVYVGVRGCLTFSSIFAVVFPLGWKKLVPDQKIMLFRRPWHGKVWEPPCSRLQ